MHFPELYIERQRLNEESWDIWHESGTDLESPEFLEYQKVLRESSAIIESIPPNDWGLEDGTLIYHTSGIDPDPEMYRIIRNKIQFHDCKDYWFPENKLSAYKLVAKIRNGSAMILREVPASFDNYEDGL